MSSSARVSADGGVTAPAVRRHRMVHLGINLEQWESTSARPSTVLRLLKESRCSAASGMSKGLGAREPA
ncbi:unnamed protein product [Boreogadus saida]